MLRMLHPVAGHERNRRNLVGITVIDSSMPDGGACPRRHLSVATRTLTSVTGGSVVTEETYWPHRAYQLRTHLWPVLDPRVLPPRIDQVGAAELAPPVEILSGQNTVLHLPQRS